MTALLERPAPAYTDGRSAGWRPALRIARRELRRAPGRTVLVLVMVLLPVTAVAALDTLLRTADISVVESLPRELGAAQARIDPLGGGVVRQSPDASRLETTGSPTTVTPETAVTPEGLRDVLPPGSRLLVVTEGQRDVGVTAAGGRAARAVLVAADLREVDARGPYRVQDGRAPASPDEVAVTEPLRRLGFEVGSSLALPDGAPRTVTGVVAFPGNLELPRAVIGLPSAVGLQDARPTRFYVSGPPVSWQDVQEVNALGASVLSRSVLLDPPPDDVVPSFDDGGQAATNAAIIGLIAIMAVLQVVLLAGPAFAVGARRQRRDLALMAATGGEPRHVRRVVLAQGVLVGAAAALVGAPLGITVAALARDPLTRWADASWGPFEVSVRDVAVFSLLGAATALLAALAPAHVAARQPVVASLQGRRPAPARAALPTAAGVVLLAVGSLMCVAALSRGFPELWIAFSALPTVIGACLLAPVLLAGAGRLAGRLPLALRYAARDADRQRARTAPAVAAIAATVAAAIALGTANASDAAEAERTYTPAGPAGVAIITAPGGAGQPAPDWAALEALARQALPDEPVRTVRGLPLGQPGPAEVFEELQICAPGSPAGQRCDLGVRGAYTSGFGSTVLVGQDAVELVAPLLDGLDAAAARRAVQTGAVAAAGVPGGLVELRRVRVDIGTSAGPERVDTVVSTTAQAVGLAGRQGLAPAQAILSEQVADALGGARTVGLVVGDALTSEQAQQLQDAVYSADATFSVYVERGYDADGDLVVLILGLVAAALVLAGTLAATSLAMAEARPDFVTLSQLGARPRSRRLMAGAYAAVIALVGAVLGLAAGLIPGVAAAVALTRNGYNNQYGYHQTASADMPSRLEFVVVPSLLIAALLLVLPLAAAALAASNARGPVDDTRRHAL